MLRRRSRARGIRGRNGSACSAVCFFRSLRNNMKGRGGEGQNKRIEACPDLKCAHSNQLQTNLHRSHSPFNSLHLNWIRMIIGSILIVGIARSLDLDRSICIYIYYGLRGCGNHGQGQEADRAVQVCIEGFEEAHFGPSSK